VALKSENPPDLNPDLKIELGNCQTTGIGSVPFEDPDTAIKLILDRCDIPYWPQLKGESMYDQFSFPLPWESDVISFYEDILEEKKERFTYPKRLFRGLYRFADLVDEKLDVIKGQIIGPITLGYYLKDDQGKALILDENWKEIIVMALRAEAGWQELFLRSLAKEVIIFLDEPFLSISGTPQFTISPKECDSMLREVLSGFDCIKGIHCCGNTDWEQILSLPINIVSFDAYAYGKNFAAYKKDIRKFIDCGGMVAWGITPSTQEIESENTETLSKKLLGLMENTCPPESSMVTPSCGLSSLSHKQAKRAMEITQDISDFLKSRFS